MLDLTPIHTFVMKEAALAAFRDTSKASLRQGDMKGHLRIHSKFSAQLQSDKFSDMMPIRHNYEIPFDLHIPNESEWLNGSIRFEPGSTVFYTDGSRKDGTVGIGVTGPGIKISKPLGSTPNIFQAEIHAIEMCANACQRRGDLTGKRIYFASNSQAALKALPSFTMKSRLVS